MQIKDYPKEAITTPESITNIMQAILEREDEIDKDKEHFWSIGLDTRNKIKYIELVSLGTLNASLIHPRETFRLAVMKGVASIIVCHNHPSGELTPSEDDLAITQRLIKSGEILSISLIDHLIIAKKKAGYKQYYSWKEEGLIIH